MRKSNGDQQADVDVMTTMADHIAALSIDQVELLTVHAIHAHRDAISKAEMAYEAWKGAASVRAHALHEHYNKLMHEARAQQMVLATLIERLGYIPNVSEDVNSGEQPTC